MVLKENVIKVTILIVGNNYRRYFDELLPVIAKNNNMEVYNG